MSILIKNGRVLDPDTGRDGNYDIYIQGDKIAEVGKDLKADADTVVDAEGCFVMPGLVDLHVHLRDPGLTHKETIESGSMAAAHGGFTTIVAMPNTKPVVDDGLKVRYVHNKAKMNAPIRVLQVGAITRDQAGEELADIAGMVREGSPAISEDGKSVMNTGIYREALKLAAKYNIPVLAHCEDLQLSNHGVVNADAHTQTLGLKGISNASEDVIVARDILMAKETGARLHICHCTTADSVRMVKLGKADGVSVTAEVCPHHFTLTSADLNGRDPNYKMAPPLRTRRDAEALKQGLKDNVIDVIATDHAPHAREEKQQPIEQAPFGIVGLETAVPLTITELVDTNLLTPMQMAQKMSYNPARIIGLDRGSLAEGKAADVVIIDPREAYTIDAGTFASKSNNTPFHGRNVKGRVKMTIFDGKVVYEHQAEK